MRFSLGKGGLSGTQPQTTLHEVTKWPICGPVCGSPPCLVPLGLPLGVTGARGIIEMKLAKEMALTIKPILAGVLVGRVPASSSRPSPGPWALPLTITLPPGACSGKPARPGSPSSPLHGGASSPADDTCDPQLTPRDAALGRGVCILTLKVHLLAFCKHPATSDTYRTQRVVVLLPGLHGQRERRGLYQGQHGQVGCVGCWEACSLAERPRSPDAVGAQGAVCEGWLCPLGATSGSRDPATPRSLQEQVCHQLLGSEDDGPASRRVAEGGQVPFISVSGGGGQDGEEKGGGHEANVISQEAGLKKWGRK